jgi:hypothetical protein
VVVDDPAGLKECITNGGSHKGESLFFQGRAYGIGQRRRSRQLFRCIPRVANDPAAGERPNKGVKRTVLLLQVKEGLRILDRSLNLEAIPDNGGIEACRPR